MSKFYGKLRWPKYKVFKDDGKYNVRRFYEFDHEWAVYSKPLATFDTEEQANEYKVAKDEI